MPAGDPQRALGLHNTLTAMSKLIPPEGSPRRLSGYPTYAFGYGNAFFIALDSNIASDAIHPTLHKSIGELWASGAAAGAPGVPVDLTA